MDFTGINVIHNTCTTAGSLNCLFFWVSAYNILELTTGFASWNENISFTNIVGAKLCQHTKIEN